MQNAVYRRMDIYIFIRRAMQIWSRGILNFLYTFFVVISIPTVFRPSSESLVLSELMVQWIGWRIGAPIGVTEICIVFLKIYFILISNKKSSITLRL